MIAGLLLFAAAWYQGATAADPASDAAVRAMLAHTVRTLSESGGGFRGSAVPPAAALESSLKRLASLAARANGDDRPMSEMSPPLFRIQTVGMIGPGDAVAFASLVRLGSVNSVTLADCVFRLAKTPTGWKITRLELREPEAMPLSDGGPGN